MKQNSNEGICYWWHDLLHRRLLSEGTCLLFFIYDVKRKLTFKG